MYATTKSKASSGIPPFVLPRQQLLGNQSNLILPFTSEENRGGGGECRFYENENEKERGSLRPFCTKQRLEILNQNIAQL